jgi:hypothetical protein
MLTPHICSCRLPAAALLTDDQILQLTKLALHKSIRRDMCMYCGTQPVRMPKYIGTTGRYQRLRSPGPLRSLDRPVLRKLDGLTSQLTADSVLHLLSWAMEKK